MRCPNMIEDEAGRLLALSQYGLNEDEPLPSLDPIVDMALRMFDVPASAVNMIGSDHVFFAASKGVGDADMSRDVSFCAHAITQDEVLVIEDAQLDARFHDNPLVQAGMIRFYAGVPLKSPSGHALGALCIIDNAPRAQFSEQDRACLKDLARMASDKLELRRLEAASQRQPSHFEASAITSPNAVLCFDPRSRISAWNDAATVMFGYSAKQMIGKMLDLLIADEDRARINAGIERVLAGGAPAITATEITGLRSNGERFPVELHWSRWYENGAMHFGAMVRDMTAQRRERDQLFHLANYDGLTGLPNRNLLHQRVEAAIQNGSSAGLIITDLDDFKDVNDTLGHGAGDLILAVIADRLVRAVPATSVVARIDGDEFATLIADDCDPLTLAAIARDIIAAIAEPIVVDGHEVRIAGSCGLAIAPDHGDTLEEFMSSADLALFQAKSGGRGRSFLFIHALRAEAVARRMYEAELYRAMERDEFMLFYQPQIRLIDGALLGAEALIRWKHPVRGLLPPSAFLPALEDGPLAVPVGTWVIRTACAQVARWRLIQPDLRMSVNLFAAQFRPETLVRIVSDALSDYGLPPEALELEITENIILHQQDRVLVQLNELRALGIALSFDDFGTGYASLNMLKSYPVTHIKIDKSFTQSIQNSPRDRAIVLSIIALAHQLGMKVVAEGVETQQHSDFLRKHACETGQGYYFGKPVPAEVFHDLCWEEPVIRSIRLS